MGFLRKDWDYENPAEYENAVAAWWIDHFVPSATIEQDADPWNDMYYLFELDDGSYAAVDPWTGKIIAE